MQSQMALPRATDAHGNIPHLNGVRGLAIFLVAMGHFFYDIYFFKITWIGLNLFFVLSGYLITRCLYQYKSYSAQGYFRNFYGRRILRIFPLYYGVLLFFFFLLPVISQKTGLYYSELNNIQGYYWLYGSNWNMIWNGMPQQPIFFHFWSLAVEEQFYLIWPVLLFICFSSGIRSAKYILVAGIICLSIVCRINAENMWHAYLSSLTAAEPLLFGCLLCILQEEGLLQKINRYLNLAVVSSALFLCLVFSVNPVLNVSNTMLMKYGYTAIDIIWVSIVGFALAGYSWGVIARKFFSMKWLIWLGKYSYSIYVFHWIILQTIVYKMQAFMTEYVGEGPAYLFSRITGITITLVVGYFSYHFFEKHFLLLKKYFTGDTPLFKWSAVSRRLARLYASVRILF